MELSIVIAGFAGLMVLEFFESIPWKLFRLKQKIKRIRGLF